VPVASEVSVPRVICCVVNHLAAPMLVVTGSLIPKQVNRQQPKVQVGTKTKKANLEGQPLMFLIVRLLSRVTRGQVRAELKTSFVLSRNDE